MYSEDDLTSAVQAGVLTPEAAAALRAYVAQRGASARVDEEHIRLITSFNDIFVAIASVLLLTAVAWLAGSAARWSSGVALALTAWGLAEFFTRRRRMAFPSILLLVAFVGGVFGSGVLLLGQEPPDIAAAAIVAAAAAWLHWRRFHVPVTVAVGIGALVVLAFSVIHTYVPHAKDWTTGISFAAGIAVLYLALRWDSADTARLTRKADVAFWLHLLAAPLIVHPVFSLLGVLKGETSVLQASIVVLFYLGLGAVSLLLDRRALLVSALLYVIWTLNALLERFGVVNQNAALTALVIGSALLLLSAFWHRSRAHLVRMLPDAVASRLPPIK
jgi:hypothetical protein